MSARAEIAPKLERLIEALTLVGRNRKLSTPTKMLEAKLAVAFRRQGRVFLRNLKANLGLGESVRIRLREDAVKVSRPLWDDAWMEAVVATLEMFVGALRDGVSEGLRIGAKDVAGDIGAAISFSLENPRALAYLHEHAFELTKNLNQTTDASLHRMLEKALEEGWSWTELSAAITETFDNIANWRAELIATCELGNAFEEGSLEYTQQLSAAGYTMEKSWLTVGDDRVEQHCRDNQGAGWIGIEEPFPSGHNRPLAHPRCRCTLLYQEATTPVSTAARAAAATAAVPARTIADVMAEVGALGPTTRYSELQQEIKRLGAEADRLIKAGEAANKPLYAEQTQVSREMERLWAQENAVKELESWTKEIERLKDLERRTIEEWAGREVPAEIKYRIAVYGDEIRNAELRLAALRAKGIRPAIEIQADLERLAERFDEITKLTGENFSAAHATRAQQRVLQTELSSLKQTAARQVQDIVGSDRPWEDLKVILPARPAPAVKKAAQEAVEAVRKLVGLDWIEEFDAHSGAFTSIKVRPRLYRAYYDSGLGRIVVGSGSPTATYVHELGHWLERQIPEIAKAANDFLARRTAGEIPEKLSKLMKGRGYRRDEIARKDKFINPYMGKDYSRWQRVERLKDGTRVNVSATEIFSMGLQYLFEDPLALFTQDPDYFAFIVGTLRRLG